MEMYSPRLQFSENTLRRPKLINRIRPEPQDVIKDSQRETMDKQIQQLFQRVLQRTPPDRFNPL